MMKVREFQKNINLCFIDYAKAFDCVDHNKLWKTPTKEMGIPNHLTRLLRNLYAVKKQWLELNMKQQVQDWERSTTRLFIVTLLTYNLHSKLGCMLSCSVVSDSFRSHGLQPARLCPWSFPGKNNRVSCHALLQGIFPTQGSNPGLPHCRQSLYHLSHQVSPRILESVTYPFSRESFQPTSWEMPGWMSYKLESRLPGEISTTSNMLIIPF